MDTLNNIDTRNDDPSTSFNEVLDDGDSEDDATWGLVNLIGLALFLAAVIGPIAYVTFCCRRPVTGERCVCGQYWLKLATCIWLDRYLTNRTAASRNVNIARNDEADRQHPRTTPSVRSNWSDPPVYNMALAMPRLDDKTPGTPPPKYDHLLNTTTLHSTDVELSDSAPAGDPSARGTTGSAPRELDLDVSRLHSSVLPPYESVNRHSGDDPVTYRYNSGQIMDNLPTYEESLLMLKTENSPPLVL